MKKFFNVRVLRGFISIVIFVVLWQFVVLVKIPYLENLPYPKEVAVDGINAVGSKTYWFDWGISLSIFL